MICRHARVAPLKGNEEEEHVFPRRLVGGIVQSEVPPGEGRTSLQGDSRGSCVHKEPIRAWQVLRLLVRTPNLSLGRNDIVLYPAVQCKTTKYTKTYW